MSQPTTIKYDGKQYTITQDAYIDGTNETILYRAHGVDADGNAVRVTWGVTEQWQTDEDLLRDGNDDSGIVQDDHKDALARLNDESNACDWDNPIAVEVA